MTGPAHRSDSRACIALLGGSFDPVHHGHVALAEYFVNLFAPDALRIIPAGNPWQKDGLHASAWDRVAMVRCAFDSQTVPVVIDEQEIARRTPTYTIDTLRSVRAELGPDASMLFLIGADQLQHLDSWQEWQHLFDYAHVCAASRPGFKMDAAHVTAAVMQEFERRSGTLEQIRNSAHGRTFIATDLDVDISATAIRAAMHHGNPLDPMVPKAVLDYIQQHHLYKN